MAHISDSGSSDFSLFRNSLRRMEPELGDSAGESRRIEVVSGVSVDASLNKCARGFSDLDGMEWESVGVRDVGGSYLAGMLSMESQRFNWRVLTNLTHITKTLNFLTGTSMPLKTFANLSSALPLLVVHSGNMTRGLSAFERISSKLSYGPSRGGN